jgi:predicted glycosyltransferase
VIVVGQASPAGRGSKALEIARRANALRRLARRERPDVAFSHSSYAQIVAARAARVPVVTMMDFEHQPANHLSFRLAQRVIVPELFPEAALRCFGASGRKVLRYRGFKEELYLAEFEPDSRVLDELELDPEQVIVVFRPPPEGALYHPMVNHRFEQVLRSALSHDDVQIVLLPRTREQAERYRSRSSRIRVPEHAVDARSLLALADLAIGGGGTMNRESALLGTPTYTVFAGTLAAVDVELIRRGRLGDLRVRAVREREIRALLFCEAA